VANPPALYDPGSMQVLFFGLAPGLIGLQQLDARVVRGSSEDLFGPSNRGSTPVIPEFGCYVPVSN
jgi:hypothetical protein